MLHMNEMRSILRFYLLVSDCCTCLICPLQDRGKRRIDLLPSEVVASVAVDDLSPPCTI